MANNDPISPKWREKMAGKDEFVLRLYTVFVSEEPKRLELIRKAVQTGDTPKIAYLAHSLKGSAATMGAETLRQCCLDLELASKAGDTAKTAKSFKDIEAALEDLFAYMRRKLENAPD